MIRFIKMMVTSCLCSLISFSQLSSAQAQDLADEKLEQIREIVTGEQEPEYHHMIGANVFGLVGQTLNLRTQHAITSGLAFVGSGHYQWSEGFLRLPFYSAGLELGVSWYPAQKMMHGFFLEPKVGLASYTFTQIKGGFLAPNVSGLFGYSWVFGRAIQLNLGAGIQYLFIVSNIPDVTAPGLNGILPTGQFSLGYVF